MAEILSSTEQDAKDRRIVTLIYVLYFIGFFTGIGALAGVIIAHAKDGMVADIWQTHITYQKRTFWFGLGLLVATAVLSLVIIGWLIGVVWLVWTVVRCIKGIMAVSDEQPIPDPETLVW